MCKLHDIHIFITIIMFVVKKNSVFHSSEKLCLIFIGATAWETIVDFVVRVKIKATLSTNTDWIRANGGIIHLIIKMKKN